MYEKPSKIKGLKVSKVKNSPWTDVGHLGQKGFNMNIFERIEFYKNQYEELQVVPDMIESYLSGYDIEGKSVDEMFDEFIYVFGDYDITKRDFMHIAKSLGYEHKRASVNDERFYTLIKG